MDLDNTQPQPTTTTDGLSSWPPIKPAADNAAVNPTSANNQGPDKPASLNDTLDGLANQTSYKPQTQPASQSNSTKPTDFDFLTNANNTQPTNVVSTDNFNTTPTGGVMPQVPAASNLSTPTSTTPAPGSFNQNLVSNTQPRPSETPSNNLGAVPPTPSQPLNFTPPASPKKKRGKLKYFIIAIVLVLLVGGVASGAYFGYVVPNKPENKLLSAISNTLSQKQVTIKGKVDVQTKQPATSYNVNYTVASDLTKHNLGLSGTVGVKGLQFPFDVRYIDKDIYFKIGGLSSIDKLAPLYKNNDQATFFLNILDSINDQWYVVDSSLLESSPEAKCVTDVSWALTEEDTAKIQAAYKKHPLFSVNSVTTASVDGKTLTKYDIKPTSDAEASAFAKELSSLSVVENINKCMKSSGSSSTSGDQELSNIVNQTTSEKMYIFIGDDKIQRIEIGSTDSSGNYSLTANFEYTVPAIEKPEGAKPVQDILGQILGPLYGNMNTTTASPLLQ